MVVRRVTCTAFWPVAGSTISREANAGCSSQPLSTTPTAPSTGAARARASPTSRSSRRTAPWRLSMSTAASSASSGCRDARALAASPTARPEQYARCHPRPQVARPAQGGHADVSGGGRRAPACRRPDRIRPADRRASPIACAGRGRACEAARRLGQSLGREITVTRDAARVAHCATVAA
jgi:hypothetical protein